MTDAQNHVTAQLAAPEANAMGDVDVLDRVLVKDAALLAGVRPEQLAAPTPCPQYNVQALVNPGSSADRGAERLDMTVTMGPYLGPAVTMPRRR